MTKPPTAEQVEFAQDVANRLHPVTGQAWSHCFHGALAAIIQTRAQIINSLRHDFDEWPDYVALSDVADALESQENSHD